MLIHNNSRKARHAFVILGLITNGCAILEVKQENEDVYTKQAKGIIDGYVTKSQSAPDNTDQNALKADLGAIYQQESYICGFKVSDYTQSVNRTFTVISAFTALTTAVTAGLSAAMIIASAIAGGISSGVSAVVSFVTGYKATFPSNLSSNGAATALNGTQNFIMYNTYTPAAAQPISSTFNSDSVKTSPDRFASACNDYIKQTASGTSPPPGGTPAAGKPAGGTPAGGTPAGRTPKPS